LGGIREERTVSEPISRRDWIKVVGAAGAGSLVTNVSDAPGLSPVVASSAATPAPTTPVDILPLSSTSDVFVPPRGRAFMKFSFDFPAPSVAFGGHRFGFLVFTDENTYGLDRSSMTAESSGDEMRLTCTRLVWAGGQEKAPGRLTATFRRAGGTVEWDAVVEMERPVKTVTAIIRGVPRGPISLAAGALADRRDNEVLGAEYDGCTNIEVWLLSDGTRGVAREKLLGEACNDGYGASGVGEDTFTFDEKGTFAHSRYGGSAWRWSHRGRERRMP
jgi:hypothetical protein